VSYPSTQCRFIAINQIPKGFSLLAPLSGEVHPLAVINQPLTNNSLLGEGVAIELQGNKLVAPFDGIVTELPVTGHRIQLKASNGIKLLISLPQSSEPLSTLSIKLRVQEQQTISKGQPLLNFNLQQLQQLNTPCYAAVIITNAEKLGQLFTSAKKVTAGEDVLLTVLGKKTSEKSPPKTPS
jgi:phosphotransferase system IIA component